MNNDLVFGIHDGLAVVALQHLVAQRHHASQIAVHEPLHLDGVAVEVAAVVVPPLLQDHHREPGLGQRVAQLAAVGAVARGVDVGLGQIAGEGAAAEELAEIAIQSARSAEAFGIPARVAMISYSTGRSGSGSEVEKVREATRLAREREPGLLLDGPLQYDAAAIASVGRQKAPDSPVAGQATVFVFPDLNTGNTTYKAVQRSANVVSVGPMLQGLRKPVNDLSRGALVDDIVYTLALTAIQAYNNE